MNKKTVADIAQGDDPVRKGADAGRQGTDGAPSFGLATKMPVRFHYSLWIALALVAILLCVGYLLDIQGTMGFVLSEGSVVLALSVVALVATFALMLILAGIGFFIMAALSFLSVLLAIVTFPVLPPFLLPLVIILCFTVSLFKRRRSGVN